MNDKEWSNHVRLRISALKDSFGKIPDYDFSESGKTIELIHTDDKYTDLKRGDIGVIEMKHRHSSIENQIWVNCLNGSDLMLLEGKDRYVVVGDLDV